MTARTARILRDVAQAVADHDRLRYPRPITNRREESASAAVQASYDAARVSAEDALHA